MTNDEALAATARMRGGVEDMGNSSYRVSNDTRELRGDYPWRHEDWLLLAEYYEALGRDLEKTAYAFYRHQSLQGRGKTSDGHEYVEELWTLDRIKWYVECLDIVTERHGGVSLLYRVEVYRAKKRREYLQRYKMAQLHIPKSSKTQEKKDNDDGDKQQQQTRSTAKLSAAESSKKQERKDKDDHNEQKQQQRQQQNWSWIHKWFKRGNT